MCPGLIDGHIHIESTFLSPNEFCNVVGAPGISAVICDPHEIVNVLRPIGFDYFIPCRYRHRLHQLLHILPNQKEMIEYNKLC